MIIVTIEAHMSLNQSHEQTFILPGQLYISLWFLIEELFLIMFFTVKIEADSILANNNARLVDVILFYF